MKVNGGTESEAELDQDLSCTPGQEGGSAIGGLGRSFSH